MGTRDLFVKGLGVTGAGIREDRSWQTRKRGRGKDTWNADIPICKIVQNHTLFASLSLLVLGPIITLYIRSNFE